MKAHKWQYTFQYPDGSFYDYAGDCGNSPHKTWCIEDATFESRPDSFWWLPDGCKIIAVRTTYEIDKVATDNLYSRGSD